MTKDGKKVLVVVVAFAALMVGLELGLMWWMTREPEPTHPTAPAPATTPKPPANVNAYQ